MKKTTALAMLLLLFTWCSVYAVGPRTFYFSSSAGDDVTHTGITSTSPWQTINKVNALIPTLAGGDTIKFLRGDVFIGRILINKAGVEGHQIVFDVYGPGTALAEITSLVTVTGWSNLGGNIWEATTTGVADKNNMVLRDGIVQRVGRTPNPDAANGGYLIYTAGTNTTLTGPALSTTKNWTNAEVAIRLFRWEIRRRTVTAHSGGVITFPMLGTITSPTTPSTPNFGYFFQRDPSTLDQDGEWYQKTNKLRMYFANNNPSAYTIKAATLDTVINNTKSYIKVRNLLITGGNVAGMYSNGGTKIDAEDCSFNYNGGEGFVAWFCYRVTVLNCKADHNMGGGIRVFGSTTGIAKNYRIENCLVTNSCLIPGMETTDIGSGGNGVNSRGGDSIWVLNNSIINSGYNGLAWHGNHVYIKYNFIDSFCRVRDDGGGIYTFEISGDTIVPGTTDRNIVSNIIDHGFGNSFGAGNSPLSANGGYHDEGTRNVVYDSNTIARVSLHAFQGNNNGNITIRHNTVSEAGVATDASQRLKDGPVTSGMVVSDNIFNGYLWRFRDQRRNVPTTVTSVQNLQRYGTRSGNFHSPRAGTDTSLWLQTQTNPTVSSPTSFVQTYNPFSYITGTAIQEAGGTLFANTGTLYYNTTNAVTSVLFPGQSKKDPRGNIYNNFANIPPHDSRILIANGTVNAAPVANAGVDKIITAPTTTVSVTGSGTDDGAITAYLWTKLSGPAGGTVATPNAATTNLNALQPGVYQFQLTVTDNGTPALTGSDVMQVTVNAATPNINPVVTVGADITRTLPMDTATVFSAATDADGTISSYAWVKFSGPAGGAITSPSAANTLITGLLEGIYQYQVTVTDNSGGTASKLVKITVNPAIPPANQNPVANAGTDQVKTLPVNTATLAGSATDADGFIASYHWVKLAGSPTGGTISNANIAAPNITGLVQGIYQYELTATDNLGATNTDAMTITVNPQAPNTPPTVSAGSDVIIQLPVNSTTVTATASDADGVINSYQWRQLSGPSAAVFGTATSASTTVGSLVEGDYLIQVSATDDRGDSALSSLHIQVLRATNVSPIASVDVAAIARQLPMDTATVAGSATDADGTIATYHWTGAGGTIVSSNAATTLITGLTAGVHVFTLTVTDNDGATSQATVTITVSAAAVPDNGPGALILIRTFVP